MGEKVKVEFDPALCITNLVGNFPCSFCLFVHAQALCLTVGNGMLYSAGTDLFIRSWNLDSLEEIGSAQVC